MNVRKMVHKKQCRRDNNANSWNNEKMDKHDIVEQPMSKWSEAWKRENVE